LIWNEDCPLIQLFLGKYFVDTFPTDKPIYAFFMFSDSVLFLF